MRCTTQGRQGAVPLPLLPPWPAEHLVPRAACRLLSRAATRTRCTAASPPSCLPLPHQATAAWSHISALMARDPGRGGDGSGTPLLQLLQQRQRLLLEPAGHEVPAGQQHGLRQQRQRPLDNGGAGAAEEGGDELRLARCNRWEQAGCVGPHGPAYRDGPAFSVMPLILSTACGVVDLPRLNARTA